MTHIVYLNLCSVVLTFLQFISSLSSLRYKKAVPPEDKAQTPPTTPPPPHARDVWAFGHFILATLDKADLNGNTVFKVLCPLWYGLFLTL